MLHGVNDVLYNISYLLYLWKLWLHNKTCIIVLLHYLTTYILLYITNYVGGFQRLNSHCIEHSLYMLCRSL